MVNKDYIQEEISKTLQSLDGVEKAKANPFLFTRIKQRMQLQENGWGKMGSFVSRPVVAIALLVLVMAVNTWSVFNSVSGDTIIENDNTNSSEIASADYAYNDMTLADNTNNYENLINK